MKCVTNSDLQTVDRSNSISYGNYGNLSKLYKCGKVIMLHLVTNVINGALNEEIILTLPEDCRPVCALHCAGFPNSTVQTKAYLDVSTNGAIKVMTPGNYAGRVCATITFIAP